MDYLLVIFFSYICGSVPFGLILTKLFTNTDIRKVGSGNIGATNVLRTGNKYLALATLFFDVIKGYGAVALTQYYYPAYAEISSIIVFLGHIFPVWMNFKGGKGVATYLGVLFALNLSLAILFIFTWIVVTLIFKYSSVSSMFASLTVLIVFVLKKNIIESINKNVEFSNDISLILFIFFILIVFTHKKNIYNLKNKIEKKIKI